MYSASWRIKIAENFLYRAFLCTRRWERERRKKILRATLRINTKARLAVVFSALKCAGDLYHKHLFEGESFTCGRCLRKFLRRVNPQKRARKIGKVKSRKGILRNRIVHVRENIRLENFLDRMTKPQRRDAATFGIDRKKFCCIFRSGWF